MWQPGAALAILLFAAAGCGAIDDPDGSTAVWTLHGYYANGTDSLAMREHRAAVLWWTRDADGAALVASQELTMRPALSAGFSLEIHRLPPPVALSPVVTGRLVFYEDGDGDGQLDLIEDDDGPSPDRIVGPTQLLLISFVEGDPGGRPHFGDVPLATGWNLLLVGDPARDPAGSAEILSPDAVGSDLVEES